MGSLVSLSALVKSTETARARTGAPGAGGLMSLEVRSDYWKYTLVSPRPGGDSLPSPSSLRLTRPASSSQHI